MHSTSLTPREVCQRIASNIQSAMQGQSISIRRLLADEINRASPRTQSALLPVMAHRLMLEPQAKFAGVTARNVVEEVVKRVPVPA